MTVAPLPQRDPPAPRPAARRETLRERIADARRTADELWIDLSRVRRPEQVLFRFPWAWRLWPPFLGVGIRVTRVDPKLGVVSATMPLLYRNQNHASSHFGGALYTMVDPMYVYLLSEQLGVGYVVWDQSATITFVRPSRSRVVVDIELDPAAVDYIRAELKRSGSIAYTFHTQVRDLSGTTIAEIEKVVHVSRKDTSRPRPVRSAAAVQSTLRHMQRRYFRTEVRDRAVEIVVLTPEGALTHHIAPVAGRWRLRPGASAKPAICITVSLDTATQLASRSKSLAQAMLNNEIRVSGRIDWAWWLFNVVRRSRNFADEGNDP